MFTLTICTEPHWAVCRCRPWAGGAQLMQDYRRCRLLFVTVNSKWFPSQFSPQSPTTAVKEFHKRIQEAENCGLIQYNFVFLFLFILNMQKLLQTLGSFSLRVSRDGAVISPCAVDLAAIHPTLTLTRCRIKKKKKTNLPDA